ncbi:hypothetical protein [Methylobrevis albus]|uniref:Uncharacterized protein n=1 Tax=Methylobrevis albus TaxID=2793297 RepID=A0A931I4K2_9HYPH|nr:hypothetical protein [Methylobrevis albus]MBH0239787.1 hypothetical protein [Methylobrevis albus]
MDRTKLIIAEAVSQYPLKASQEWARAFGNDSSVEIDHIETSPTSYDVHDYLFEGQAQVFLRHGDEPAAQAVSAHVFGRCDGRRVELDRFVFDIAS